MKSKSFQKFVVGVDEVGRGPLAGPVAVGVVVFNTKNKNYLKIKEIFRGARDSKKLTAKKREEIFQKIKIAEKTHILRYIVRYESNKVIDKKGISFAIRSCIEKAFKNLNLKPKDTRVFLDGGLKAPKNFIFQKTIIKGDDKVLAISLASIVAKVSRDSFMTKISNKFPEYSFHAHKGYGTNIHRKAVKKHGFCPVHRLTFSRNIILNSNID